jgi:hypothetical protein
VLNGDGGALLLVAGFLPQRCHRLRCPSVLVEAGPSTPSS